MKKLILFGLVALLAIGLSAPPARAVNVGAREWEANFDDNSSIFVDDNDDGNGAGSTPRIPVPLDPNPFMGLPLGTELRTVYRIETIKDADTLEVVYNTSFPTWLTGVIYDLELKSVYMPGTPGVGAGQIILDFAPLGRNPLTADLDGDSVGALDPTTGLPITFGGVVELYEDPAKNYTPNPGPDGVPDTGDEVVRYDSKLPSAPGATVPLDAGAGPLQWAEGANGFGHAPGAAGADTMPTVTDGTYTLAGALVELQYLANIGLLTDPANIGAPGFAPGTVLRETLNFVGQEGSGFAYMNVFAEPNFSPPIARGFHAALADLSLNLRLSTPRIDAGSDKTFFTGDDFLTDTGGYDGVGQWSIDSQDPVRGATVPEPATMALLGIGLLGIAIGRKKRS